ncbi:argininosuccinate synthase [candidate division FCPU426 bacterium]|nr:argininosuccinate synthase [candidate division FCPU426 bacterium]
MKIKKVVLAYSGGLDTSVIIPWLKDNYGCEVIAFAADIGQEEELRGLPAKARKTGAAKCLVLDLKREFAEEYLLPLLKSGAVYEGKYLLGTSIARPLIAKHQVAIARQEGADAVAHGCTGKGNDQVRFELTYQALAPDLRVIAPWRDPRWTIRSREDALRYAREKQVPVAQTLKKIYSRDRNLWHLSHEGGELEDPWQEPRAGVWTLTQAPEKAPARAAFITIGFHAGKPVHLNGVKQDLVRLIQRLNKLAGQHGVGRTDLVENRLVGMKSRGAYETPGGTVLVAALHELLSLVLDRETMHVRSQLALRYADLVYNGQWFTPLRESLDAFTNCALALATGEVRMKLYKGQALVAGRRSLHSLFSTALATFGEDDVYRQADATGFIALYGLPLKVKAWLNAKRKKARR